MESPGPGGWRRTLRELGPWIVLPPVVFVGGVVVVWLLTRSGAELPFVYAAH